MTYSIIQRSQLEGALRLDAEFYQPEYLEMSEKLHNFGTTRLEAYAYITDGEHGSPIFDETSGIKYFSAQHVKDCLINGDNANNISKIIDDENRRSRLKEGDILLSTVGTIGYAGLITKELLPANIDRHVARIALNNNDLDPEFLVAFLNSKFGRFQSIRESTGNVQLNIFIDKIKELKVPRKNNPEISILVKMALQALRESKKYYQQAVDLLLDELGLKDFEKENNLYSIVNLSEVQSANRIDAEYFQKKYYDLLAIISKNKTNGLGTIAKRKTPREKSDSDLEYKYTEISDVNVSNGDCTSNDVSGGELPANAKISVKGGELIVSKVRPTRGAIAIIPDDWKDNHLVSGAFSVFEVASPIREYLQVVLRSVVGKLQMERPTTGTSYPTITDQDVENIIVPILPDNTQQKIADLVRKSHAARQKSKQLIEEAKRKVEEMIEKGGDSNVKKN